MLCCFRKPMYFAAVLFVLLALAAGDAPADTLTLPAGTKSIEAEAFYGDTGLEEVVLPEGLTSIGSCAFANCSSLTAVTIPEGVTDIGACAFQGCVGLSVIQLPESLTSIGQDAFGGISGLCVLGFAGSYAESWALANNFEFQAVLHTAFTDDEITNRLLEMKDTYYDGYPWSDSNVYTNTWFVGKDMHMNFVEYTYTVCGDRAFCMLLSDAVFGRLPVYEYSTFDFDSLGPGDIIQYKNGNYSVIVLRKYGDSIEIVESNYNGAIHWGRIMTRDELAESYTNVIKRDP